MKNIKNILILSGLAFLGFAPHVFAQGFTALAPIPGLTDNTATSVVNPQGFASFFNNLYKYCIGLAATLAVIQIVWAGVDIAIFHKDAVSAITDDKGKIYNAIFGLILVLSPVLVFSIINPSILNLSLNLPKLNTSTSGSTTGSQQGTATSQAVGAALSAHCTQPVTGITGIQSIICPQQKDAQAFADACNLANPNGGNGQVTEVPLSSPTQYRATCNKSFSTGGTCSVTGTSGILQIANCPTNDAATTWGQQNCVNGNNLSIFPMKNPSNGVLTNIATCAGSQYYIFINPPAALTFSINQVRPLISTTNTPPDRANNGSDAMTFTNICHSAGLGLQTCISDSPLVTSATPCNLPAGPNSSTPWKCYKETLSCENPLSAYSTKCSETPSWTLF